MGNEVLAKALRTCALPREDMANAAGSFAESREHEQTNGV